MLFRSKKTVTFKKLKKNTRYQIRVRAYKKVGNKTYYSGWKKVILKTTKKKSKTYKY